MTQWLSAGQEVLVPSLPSLVSQTLTPSELKVVLHMQRWLRCSATRIRKTCWASSVLWKPPLLESKFFSGNPWLKEKALESYQRGIKFSTISDHDSSRSHPKSYKRSWDSLLCYWFSFIHHRILCFHLLRERACLEYTTLDRCNTYLRGL